MRWIAARSEIYIRGSIGPGFADRLLHLLAQEPTARRIVITSEGGLVKEAMKVASLVEKSDTDVVARETCNSACILILLAAHKRYADWDMEFGFHIPVELLPNSDGTFAPASSAAREVHRGLSDGSPRSRLDHRRYGARRSEPCRFDLGHSTRRGEPSDGFARRRCPRDPEPGKMAMGGKDGHAARLGFRINSDSLSRHRFAGCVRRGPLREHPLRNRPAQEPRPLRL